MTIPELRPGQPLPALLGQRDGISVVLFVRGSWCPVCRRQLTRMAEHETEWAGFGAHLIAVSSSELTSFPADDALRRLPIEFIHDPNGAEIKRLGIGHEHPEHGIIAHPVTLIATDGIIRYAHIGTHSRDRPEPEAILLGVSSLQDKQTR